MASNINTTNIDTTFPVAGQDNDSQGFRDNFFNTNENFGFAKAEIEALQGATTGNYVFDIGQVPDNTMDNWVLTYDDGTGLVGLEVIPAQASAAEGTEGIVFLATSGEVLTGTNLVKAVTPATLQAKINAIPLPASATEGAEGIIFLATEAEVLTGTEATKAVTSLNLQTKINAIPVVPSASDTVKGIIELATQAEVDAGTDTIRAVTPLTLTNWSGGGGGGGVTNPMTADLTTGGFSIITASGTGGNTDSITIQTGDPENLGTAGDINITAGSGDGAYAYGGNILLTSGAYGAGPVTTVQIRSPNPGIGAAGGVMQLFNIDNLYSAYMMVEPQLGVDTFFVLPPTDGVIGDVLTNTDGAGATAWVAPSGTTNNWVTANNGADFIPPPTAPGSQSIAFGNDAYAKYDNSIAIGTNADSGQLNGIAIGRNAVVNSAAAAGIAVGKGTLSGGDSVTIGNTAKTNATGSAIAIGKNTEATILYSVKLGYGTPGSDINQIHLHDRGKLELVGNEAMFVAPPYVKASPPANPVAGAQIYVSDATNNSSGALAATGAICFYNGSIWIDVTTGVAVV